MVCLGCKKNIPIFKVICFGCLKIIYELSVNNSNEQKISSLFSYQEPLRSLVISAKVERNWLATQSLKKILSHSVRTQYLLEWADYVTPAPSSLWSRIHLKFDLAYILAHHLTRKTKATLVPPPWTTGWNISKQSKRKRRSPVHSTQAIPVDNRSKKNILLIDDVTTSGQTLNRLEKHFPHYNVRALCLCSAKS